MVNTSKVEQIFKCNVCGNIVAVLTVGGGELVCCNQPMELMEEKTSDVGKEKLDAAIAKVKEIAIDPVIGDVFEGTVVKILDAGAQGVLIPYVNNKEEAELAVKTCKYPTEGIRGVAGSPRAAGYGMNIGNYLQRANEEIFIMIAVETPEAVKNLDEILEVEGLDGIFIGPMDLASSMGYFGNPSEPKVQAAIKEIEGKVFASDKVLATTTGTWEGAQTLYERGYDMLMLMADGINLAKMAKQKMTEFREHYPNG